MSTGALLALQSLDHRCECIDVGIAHGDVREAVPLPSTDERLADLVNAADCCVREVDDLLAGEPCARDERISRDLGATLNGDEVQGGFQLDLIEAIAGAIGSA